MVIIKQMLEKKERKMVESILSELSDVYSDFYITRNNLRLYIKENLDLLYESLEKGDRIAYDSEGGIGLIIGYSDKSPRKYLKLIAKDERLADRIIKCVLWNIPEELFVKIKKNSPYKQVFEKNGFRFAGDRGQELLLCRKGLPQNNNINLKDEDKENE